VTHKKATELPTFHFPTKKAPQFMLLLSEFFIVEKSHGVRWKGIFYLLKNLMLATL
jgi:hypothetical protein